MPWRLIGRAVEAGLALHPGNGTYALPGADDGRLAAQRMTGVVSHRTAALHWGWKVKTVPPLPDVTIPANCCLDLPFDEALSVLDSGPRAGLSRRGVVAAAAALGPRHRARVLAVERFASAKAANPFESVLRAIALSFTEKHWDPQHRIRYDDFCARVDLAHDDLGIVLEADSFEFHGERAAVSRDCERHDELVARGWLVLRFTWEQVVLRPEWVAGVIERTVRWRLAERGGRRPDERGQMTEARPRAAVA